MLTLHDPACSSEYHPEFGAAKALHFDEKAFVGHQNGIAALAANDKPFCSNPSDSTPCWWANLPPRTITSHVQVFGDTRRTGQGDTHFSNIVIELLDCQDRVLFQSHQLTSVDPHQALAPGSSSHVVIAIPGALCASKVRIRKANVAGVRSLLCLSLVRCFGRPAQTLLLLARHGQADHNIATAYDRTVGPGLTEQGCSDAAAIPQKVLEGFGVIPDVILVSPQRRALETSVCARLASPELMHVPIFILRQAYEHSWHQGNGAQIPPSDCSAWPGQTAHIVNQDSAVMHQMTQSLDRVPGVRPGSVTGEVLAPWESAEMARQRGASLLEQLRARSAQRAQSNEPHESVILMIAHGGINHDLLCSLDPMYTPFMLQHSQRNGDVMCVGLDF